MSTATLKKTKPAKDSNQKVMRQFLSLPIILGSLLVITGAFGIYVSKNASTQLIHLNDTSIGPTIAFDEIVANLNLLSQNILRINQVAAKKEDQEKLLKKSRNLLKKIGKQAKAQVEESKGQAFGAYLVKWVTDWDAFQTALDPKLETFDKIKPEITQTNESISDLVEKMGNVSTFIQADAKDLLDAGTQFSKKATLMLAIVLSVGFFIGLFFSVIIVRSIRNLFTMIAEGKRNIETLLNNLDQGFLVFDKNGKVQEGVSKAAKTFLGDDPTNGIISDVIPTTEKGKEDIKGWLELVYGGALRFVDFEPLAPQSFESDGRYVKLDFRPIFLENSDEKLDKVICIASDKTEERRLRQKAEKEASLVKLVMTVLSDRGSFVDFVMESRKNIADLRAELSKTEPSIDVLFRGMHSVKGGAAAFSMSEVSRKAHELENRLADIKVEGNQKLFEFLPKLKEGIVEIHTLFEGVS